MNGFAVVWTGQGHPLTYRIESRHRTQEAAERIARRELRTNQRAAAPSHHDYTGSFHRVFTLVDGEIGEQISPTGGV